MHNIFKTNESPIIIAGPCSVESLSQMRQVIQALPHNEVAWIRGGIWKPRTRPGGFEGMGREALQWISDLKREFPSLRFCTEVAQPEHVELCLQHGVDAVWIGSRTTGNPFSVGEICNALQNTHLPVLVKNPMTPDINLWIGAIERVSKAGIESVAAVHRGFSLYNNLGYRNNPLWEVPIELKRQLPDLPLLCDPSHIGGKRELLHQLMQTAMDLHFDGLMIEVHPSPDSALTDADQQLTPEDFFAILKKLSFRKDSESTPFELKHLREQIDLIDAQLIHLLSERLETSKKIAEVKGQNNMAVYQPKRWEEVLERKLALAQEHGIDPSFVKDLYEKIHAESVKVQLSKD